MLKTPEELAHASTMFGFDAMIKAERCPHANDHVHIDTFLIWVLLAFNRGFDYANEKDGSNE